MSYKKFDPKAFLNVKEISILEQMELRGGQQQVRYQGKAPDRLQYIIEK